MIEEVGFIYFALIVMLFICVAIDIFSYIVAFCVKQIDYKEYCTYGIKIAKLILYLVFGIIMFALGIFNELSVSTRIVHIIIGSLLIADFIFGLVLKLKFGKKKR